MEALATRTLTSQLADDLAWLEEHCRRQPDQAAQAAHLRLAAALVRNCIGPFLEGQPPAPLHVVVVGGAGAGKSTVVNLLSGTPAAEANPQAGFTRHPIAYVSANGAPAWPAYLGFLGPLQRLTQPCPSNLDEDVYQVRRVPGDPAGTNFLRDVIVWDCPDMTTWAATGYVPRLLEVAGLADVVIYVASDERYNDEVPTQFLQLLLQSGKPVVACLMKMKEIEVPAILAHFQREVLAKLTGQVVAAFPIPFLPPAELARPTGRAAQYRIPLLNQVGFLGNPPAAARQRVVRGASNYLMTNLEHLVAGARRDLVALESWRELVHAGQREFDNRYRREFLTSEKFRRFDEALVRLLELLELPGIGRILGTALWVVRTPYRLLKGLVTKALSRPESVSLPEMHVLEGALTAWLNQLRTEAARRATTHAVWAHIAEGFAGDLGELARERFQQGVRSFQLGLADETERTARAIYEELEKNPVALNALRGGKLALDVAAISATVVAGGINWTDFILVPLAASVTQQLVEWLGKGYVDAQREQTRLRQQALVTQYLSGPLAEWLTQWPATGGSTYERLQLALRRIPLAVQQLDRAVTETLAETTKEPSGTHA